MAILHDTTPKRVGRGEKVCAAKNLPHAGCAEPGTDSEDQRREKKSTCAMLLWLSDEEDSKKFAVPSSTVLVTLKGISVGVRRRFLHLVL